MHRIEFITTTTWTTMHRRWAGPHLGSDLDHWNASSGDHLRPLPARLPPHSPLRIGRALRAAAMISLRARVNSLGPGSIPPSLIWYSPSFSNLTPSAPATAAIGHPEFGLLIRSASLLITLSASSVEPLTIGADRARRNPVRRAGMKFTTSSIRAAALPDRKSTRLNSSHVSISYAVFC